MPCYDIEGAPVDCNDAATVASGEIGYSAPTDFTVSSNNPVAQQAASSNSPAWLAPLLNFGSSVTTTVLKSTVGTQSNLRLQVNPSTGQMQYFNPSTGQYIGGPVNTTGNFFGAGGGSIVLIVAAIVVGFLAFAGRRKAA